MSAHEPHCDFARYGEGITHVESYSGPKFHYAEYLANGMKPYEGGLNTPGKITDVNYDLRRRRAVCTCKVKP